MGETMKFTERTIARYLAQQYFNRRNLAVVPNCNFTGHEADLLVVCPDLRLIDVEIKISRTDLRADARKEKWWQSLYREHHGVDRQRLEWPQRVWKHYYAMPKEIWSDDLLPSLGSPASGVLTLQWVEDRQLMLISCRRRAKPCRDAQPISPEAVVNVARLANLRMWDSFRLLDEKQEAA